MLTAVILAVATAGAVGCGGPLTTTQTQTVTSVKTVVTTDGRTAAASGATTRKAQPAADPTDYESALRTVRSGREMPGMARFASPSGNFACDLELDAGVGACELTRVRLTAAPEDRCPPDVEAGIGRLEIVNGKVIAECNSDTIRQSAAPPVLPYGRVATATGSAIACVSHQTGITCIDAAAKVGFFVNTAGYRIFTH